MPFITRTDPRWPGVATSGVWLVALLFGLAGPSQLAHATHQSGTLTETTTTVNWSNLTLTGANADETTCTEDVTCETYVLTLAPGDYTGKRITVAITWLDPANDWDLFVHEGSPGGPIITQSADFVPDNEERGTIPIDPPVVVAPKTYYVHVVAFAVTVPGYDGEAALVTSPNPGMPIYATGTSTFAPNIALKVPVAARDGEPSVRVDVKGNCYVGGIRGVPAGVDLWRFDLDQNSPSFDPGMQNPTYLGQPDAFLPQDPNDPTAGGADGGGDIDISVSFPTHPDSNSVVTITSLAAANISSAVSYDLGETFTLSPATAITPADDRQWNESTGPSTVYLMYRAPIPATGLFMQRSDDNGITYPITGVINPSGTTPGYLDVDHSGPFAGRVYAAHMGSNTLTVGHSTDGGLTWKNNTVDNTTEHGVLFDAVKVGDDGTVYTVWSDRSDIWLSYSTDGGVTWTNKLRVNDDSVYQTNLMPWIEAGSAGRIVVVWYGSPAPLNGNNADWDVLLSQSIDALSPTPTFSQQVISDHVIHGSNISLGGLTGNDNRNLIDYFQVAIDPQGAAVVAFTDDHNDFDGHTYVTRQLDGPSLYAAANGTGLVNPVVVAPPPAPSPSEPEVTDFLHDAVTGLLQPIVTDNPSDILWVDYECEDPGNDPGIAATMKVSDLTALPAGFNWRINFTANAPGGLSDRGDQFYMRMNSDVPAVPTFDWGTTVRNSDGSLTYTSQGTTDFGTFDPGTGTIKMRVSLSQLNAFADPDIEAGSVLHGLRASAFTTGANGVRDITRGGTSFTYQPCGPTPALLSRFVAESEAEGIRVRWAFGPTASIGAVEVERGATAEGPWAVPALVRDGDAMSGSVLDEGADPGRTYFYRLVATGENGDVMRFGPVSGIYGIDASAPLATILGAPTPNPARGRSSIDFQIARPGHVELSVFDPSGRRVRSIMSGVLAPGTYSRSWDGRTDRFSDAPAGVYFYVLNTTEGRLTERISVVR